MQEESIYNFDLWNPVLDTVSEGIVVVDGEGIVRHINTYAAETLGLPTDEAIGRHFREVFCPSLPLDRCWINLALAKGEKLRHHRFVIEHKNNLQSMVIANFTPITHNETKQIGALVTLRKDNESDFLRAEREKQQAILGSLAEGLFTVDNEWRITSFNRAAERITGWQEMEVLGKHCRQVFVTGQCSDGCPLAETLKHGKPMMDYAMQLCDRVGKPLDVNVNSAILYNGAAEAIGGVVSFRDCSIQQYPKSESTSANDFYGLVGKSKRMLELYQLIKEIADSDATVLLLGESGTGKELVANAIQKISLRRDAPYVRVNCAAIPETLLESELFGHVKGAFTDAQADRIGRFELANGGTIFLDEVGDLTPAAQLRLLRVLEEGEFQKVGSSTTVKVDVRIIAATNRNLWQMVQIGSFRDDLYYRLNVIPINLPPLRQRSDDLPYLIDHFMEKYRRITGKNITDISDQAYDLLMTHEYLGNVRELENIIEHAFARTKGNIITENKLPIALRQSGGISLATPGYGDAETSDEAERIRKTLVRCHWNRENAAKLLGMSRTTLWRRMRELDLFDTEIDD